MPYTNLSASLAPAQATAIATAIATIKTNLPFLINLTPDERQSFSKMGDDGFVYVTKALEHAANNASIIPPAISVAEGKKDLDLANALRPILQQLTSLVESVDDTMMAAGVEAKDFADNFYNIVKVMATTNTPGMNAIAEDLAGFYEKASNTETPPTP
jgi:hypothetical protein